MNPNRAIIHYTNYREFLRDYYKSRKKEMKSFTYRVMDERAGFASGSFHKQVIDGKKNVTKDSIAKIARGLKLNKKSTEYFENIVLFTQAKKYKEKLHFLRKIDSLRKRYKPELLLPGEFDYLKEWYHVVIREIVELPCFEESPEKIAARLSFEIKPDEVKKSIDFLIRHGFLVRDHRGALKKRDKTLATGKLKDNPALALMARQYHLKMVELAEKAVAELQIDERNVTNTTLTFSKRSYNDALKRIENLRYELLELASSDEEADQVFQVNINVFPMTKREPEQ